MLATPEDIGDVQGRGPRGVAFNGAVRRTPIRWRILAIAIVNSALALVLLGLIWNGAQVLGDAWSDLRRVRQSERFLASLGADAERLQSLIHRYFAQTDPVILERIVDLREMLVSRLRVQARLDPLISEPARNLTTITERLVAGFDELRDTRAAISLAYSAKIVDTARDMATLYGAVTGTNADPNVQIWATLGASREAYNEMILAANAFYLSGAASAAREARAKAALIRQTTPTLLALASEPAQKRAFDDLAEKAETFEEGINDLGLSFTTQSRLLREAIDGNASDMSSAIDGMRAGIQSLERSAQTRFDRTLQDVSVKLAVLAIAFVALVALMGIAIGKSISEPLGQLRSDMTAIMAGQYDRRIAGLNARDEIGEMARVVDVFRGNAIEKRKTDEDLRTAKEKAETTLAEMREMQTTLIEAEKLAALGGLVAGVAHEVNNPVGISLTVASTLANRMDTFAAEIAAGQIRRSRLEAFTNGTRAAASQLVANLQRAAELIQSFKQVAVDRSHAERRSFDLGLATEQILASLRPILRSSRIKLVVDIPDGIVMDSFPGPFGQIVTNLLLNAVHHAFPDGATGTISIVARVSGPAQVRLVFRDDGHGMNEEVQRQAFEPFFTTRRGSGGTGLGLHIVYNLVTQRLGGRIVLSSAEGSGTSFLLVIPMRAPDEVVRAGPSFMAGQEIETVHVGS
ncbi:ATP-binding protein [uncultured Enterovirga sp.]|uniref:sensor histidine kinase n=1 Tax=uncultured Enterovirga sp. TaxID=2026352 RepID=UPI0035CB9C78